MVGEVLPCCSHPPMIPRNLQHFASSNRQVIAFVTEEARHAATLEAPSAPENGAPSDTEFFEHGDWNWR